MTALEQGFWNPVRYKISGSRTVSLEPWLAGYEQTTRLG